jgi:hypothetical protein
MRTIAKEIGRHLVFRSPRAIARRLFFRLHLVLVSDPLRATRHPCDPSFSRASPFFSFPLS